MSPYRLHRNSLVRFLREIIKEEVDNVADTLMDRFDKEIVPFEDEEDPARPSVFREEFERFLKDTIRDNISITSTSAGNRGLSVSVDIGVGDESKLGFGERLDEETTDGLRIIGTILQGIVGRYVLVTSEMTGGHEGRFGKAFLLSEDLYRKEAIYKGWDPNRPIWSFSNFPGVQDFFSDINFKDIAARIAKKLAEAVKK